MIMKVILTNVSCKKGAATREREGEAGEKERHGTKGIRRREIDGRLTKSG